MKPLSAILLNTSMTLKLRHRREELAGQGGARCECVRVDEFTMSKHSWNECEAYVFTPDASSNH
jgi:hypothetical protein